MIFFSLVEGQSGVSPVYDRVISVVHLEIVLLLANGGRSLVEEVSVSDDKSLIGDDSVVNVDDGMGMSKGHHHHHKAHKEEEPVLSFDEISEEERILRAECMVFINMMCDYRPSLRTDLRLEQPAPSASAGGSKRDAGAEGGADAAEEEEEPPLKELSESTVSVEILWAGDLQRRYFYMPAVCSYIAKTSMDKLVQFVERSNNESKLKDFIQRLRDMYRECKHQQMLNELGLSSLFNQSNHSRATWLAFYLACAINGLYLGFYNYKGDDDDNSDIDPNVKIAVTVLGVLQIIVAVFGLVLSIVVRSPVVFNKHMEDAEENGTLGDPHTYTYYRSVFRAIRQTACEPMTVYYMGYVAFAVLGTTYNNFFNVLLLLDLVVKNPTCMDVLMAAYLPREALAMAALLGVFVLYIFSFFSVRSYLFGWFGIIL
jgi:hypothetical protein